MANTRNVPCEEIELHYPLRIKRYELRPEAPGDGRFRGGVGNVRDVRFRGRRPHDLVFDPAGEPREQRCPFV